MTNDDITGNSNPEIPKFGLAHSRDFGIEKRSGIPGFGIPGLESLLGRQGMDWMGSHEPTRLCTPLHERPAQPNS